MDFSTGFDSYRMLSGCVSARYLQVSMDYVLVVAVLHSIDDGLDDSEDLGFCQSLATVLKSSDSALQTATSHQLEHHVEVILVLEDLVQLHDIGMIDAVEDFDFVEDRVDVFFLQLASVVTRSYLCMILMATSSLVLIFVPLTTSEKAPLQLVRPTLQSSWSRRMRRRRGCCCSRSLMESSLYKPG